MNLVILVKEIKSNLLGVILHQRKETIMGELYTWHMALYWFHHEPYGVNGFNIVKNAWYGYLNETTNS